MAKYYILIKKNSSKNWLGAIPAKSGVTLARLRKGVSGQIKQGYAYRIITSSQLKRLILQRRTKTNKKPMRRTVKKRTRRVKRRNIRRRR